MYQHCCNLKTGFLILILLVTEQSFLAAQTDFSVSVNDTTILLSQDGSPLLHYRHALLPPPEGEPEKWARSGFIHPVYSPSGEVLTWAQPPDHYHHLGLWNPFTKVTWRTTEGHALTTDFWNLGLEQGTVRFKEIVSTNAGNGYAGFNVTHDHVAFVPGQDNSPYEEIVLTEEWIVRISDHPKGYLLDFTSLIRNATRDQITLDAYRYGGGIGFRATEKWNTQNSTVLTSEGKTRANGDATRAKWCRISGELNNRNTGILFLDHPDNFDSPQPMRIWPENINGGAGHQYFEFTPIRENSWILDPGKTYSQRYMLLVYEGELEADEADRLWNKYADQLHVLIYTRNGEGFVHDNIAASVQMLEDICDKNGIICHVSDDPDIFTVQNLQHYQAVIFSNTNNDAFTSQDQRHAFRSYIQNGGGFVGIHSACGSERNWPWFWQMLGGSFLRHPPFQSFDVKVVESKHPSTCHLDSIWKWEDEPYYLHHLNPGVQVLLAHDLTTIDDQRRDEFPGSTFGDYFPGAWCQKFDGGVQWYTSYGHSIEHYSDPDFIQHVEGGLLWVLDELSDLYED